MMRNHRTAMIGCLQLSLLLATYSACAHERGVEAFQSDCGIPRLSNDRTPHAIDESSLTAPEALNAVQSSLGSKMPVTGAVIWMTDNRWNVVLCPTKVGLRTVDGAWNVSPATGEVHRGEFPVATRVHPRPVSQLEEVMRRAFDRLHAERAEDYITLIRFEDGEWRVALSRRQLAAGGLIDLKLQDGSLKKIGVITVGQ